MTLEGGGCDQGADAPEGEYAYRRPHASWARLLCKIFEIDPLLCSKCGIEMKVVSVITEPEVVGKILQHIARTRGWNPFERRLGTPSRMAGSWRAIDGD